MTISPNCFSADQPALGDGGVGEFLAGAEGGPPIWPAGLTVFWLLMAEMTSLAVILSLANWSGLTQKRIAYWPAPKTFTFEMPLTRVIWSTRLM